MKPDMISLDATTAMLVGTGDDDPTGFRKPYDKPSTPKPFNKTKEIQRRLRQQARDEERRMLREERDRPWICPGCFAVDDDPHSSWCPDHAIEQQMEDDRMYGRHDDDDNEDDCDY